MSEIAGRLAAQAGAYFLQDPLGGRGLLVGGVPGVAPARVTVLGGGVVGTHAARMAVGLGAEVVILDRSLPRLRQLDDLFAGRVRTRFSTLHAIEEEAVAADVIVGAVLVPGASAPKLVSRQLVSALKRGTVLVDVAIDGALPPGARPDLTVDGTIEIERLPNVLHVGRPAYGQANTSVELFRLEPDGRTASRVRVQFGRGSVKAIEIVDGLREGDRIILSDLSQYDDHPRLKLRS
jgi:hypothetical protein